MIIKTNLTPRLISSDIAITNVEKTDDPLALSPQLDHVHKMQNKKNLFVAIITSREKKCYD